MLIMWMLIVLAGVMGKPKSYLDILEEDVDSTEAGQKHGAAKTNCTCGVTNKGRVVGGRETLVNEFPLIAGVYSVDENLLFCGANILTAWHALTASHCLVHFQGQRLALLVGEHDITKRGETKGKLIPISKAIEHAQYNMETMENDIGLVLLKFPLKFNKIIGPACLPTKMFNLEGEFVKVLGWGLTSDGGVQSSALQKANLKVIRSTECKRIHDTKPGKQLCTWMRNRDSCDGDSGGPLLWLDPQTNRYTLAGVVSYGKVCASVSPAVYTNVAGYLGWIQAEIAGSCYSKNQLGCYIASKIIKIYYGFIT